jgi:hypothetical protein
VSSTNLRRFVAVLSGFGKRRLSNDFLAIPSLNAGLFRESSFNLVLNFRGGRDLDVSTIRFLRPLGGPAFG